MTENVEVSCEECQACIDEFVLVHPLEERHLSLFEREQPKAHQHVFGGGWSVKCWKCSRYLDELF